MRMLTIAPGQWKSRLNKLSQSLEGRPVSLEIVARADGQVREFDRIPLLGITAEPQAIVISAADVTGEHVTHIIQSPTRVLLETTDSGVNVSLAIECAGGEKSVLRFR